MRPTVKLRHGLFENPDNAVVRIWLPWKELLVFHGLAAVETYGWALDDYVRRKGEFR